MRGDFTRTTFDPLKHFSRVLFQQGRVSLDADDNEQSAILLHHLRTLAKDLLGPHAAPADHAGFSLLFDADGLHIGTGRYYVDGILVENDDDECLYTTQPDYPLGDDDPLAKEASEQTGKVFWVYLDVWERHITSLEDRSLREKALRAGDTCTRAKVVWQVKARETEETFESAQKARADRITKLENEEKSLLAKLGAANVDPVDALKMTEQLADVRGEIARLKLPDTLFVPVECATMLDELARVKQPKLTARVDPGRKSDDACIMAPSSRYRGAENHLYRVEIHDAGLGNKATFKWSRDNGSVASEWLGTYGNDLRVASTRGFAANRWVELGHDAQELQGLPGMMVRVAKVEGETLSIDPTTILAGQSLPMPDKLTNPKVRLWDQTQNSRVTLTNGVIAVKESPVGSPVWLDLEDGVQVQFAPGGDYQTGDHWLIPARVATGDIEWPMSKEAAGKITPLSRPPEGINHHYAPLGFVVWHDKKMQFEGCRCEFPPLAICLDKVDTKATRVRARRRRIR